MEYCSKIIENIAYFGPAPNQTIADSLIKEGITVVIDLTTAEDRIEPYVFPRKLNYPIQDNKIPEDLNDFTDFINNLVQLINNGEKIYVHCRAGHGRSGMVAVCLLCEINKYSPIYAIKLVTEYHKERNIMKDKWRTRTCPNSKLQRKFLKDNFGYSDAHYVVDILRRTMIKFNNVEVPLENYIDSKPNINMFDTILTVARNNDTIRNCFLYSKRPFYSKNSTLFKLMVGETGNLLNSVKKNL